MTTFENRLIAKIPDSRLREFAISQGNDERSVLIDVEAPEPTVAISSHPSLPALPIGSEVVFSEDEERQEKIALEQTHRALELLGLASQFLSASRVFVVKANPEQLRRLCEEPSIRHILPNRSVGR